MKDQGIAAGRGKELKEVGKRKTTEESEKRHKEGVFIVVAESGDAAFLAGSGIWVKGCVHKPSLCRALCYYKKTGQPP